MLQRRATMSSAVCFSTPYIMAYKVGRCSEYHIRRMIWTWPQSKGQAARNTGVATAATRITSVFHRCSTKSGPAANQRSSSRVHAVQLHARSTFSAFL